MCNSVMDYTNNIYLRVWDRGMIFEDLVEQIIDTESTVEMNLMREYMDRMISRNKQQYAEEDLMKS